MDIERYNKEQVEKLAEMYRHERYHRERMHSSGLYESELRQQQIPNRAARRKAKSLRFK